MTCWLETYGHVSTTQTSAGRNLPLASTAAPWSMHASYASFTPLADRQNPLLWSYDLMNQNCLLTPYVTRRRSRSRTTCRSGHSSANAQPG